MFTSSSHRAHFYLCNEIVHCLYPPHLCFRVLLIGLAFDGQDAVFEAVAKTLYELEIQICNMIRSGRGYDVIREN